MDRIRAVYCHNYAPGSVGSLLEKIEEGRSGILMLKESFSKVDCRKAQASLQTDEDRVKHMIETTVA